MGDVDGSRFGHRLAYRIVLRLLACAAKQCDEKRLGGDVAELDASRIPTVVKTTGTAFVECATEFVGVAEIADGIDRIVTLKIGSLFTGYGGLDMATQNVFGGDVVWFCDNDSASTKLLAHHFPDVPNLGDIRTVNWDTVEPIDILTGGFPCQDISLAGNLIGLAAESRSGLWSQFAVAINVLKPKWVIIENVRGILSASAVCDLEWCPWCVGATADEQPVLRALGAVLGDLATIGYDAEWTSVRASDIGAPHGRDRIFVLAYLQRQIVSDAISGRG